MAPKYTKGQKVTIVSVKNQHTHLKYPQFEPHVSKSGTIIEFYWIGLEGINVPNVPRDNYIYTVRIDDKEVDAIPEECLELSID